MKTLNDFKTLTKVNKKFKIEEYVSKTELRENIIQGIKERAKTHSIIDVIEINLLAELFNISKSELKKIKELIK